MPDSSRIEDLRRRVQADPGSIAFAQLAEEYRRARQYQDSVKVCQTGLRTHPRFLSARVTLGRALMELERFDEAREELELVLKSEPQNLAAIRALAETHRRRGAWSEALQQYRAALELASNDPDLERTVNELAMKASRPAGAAAPVSSLEQRRQPVQGGQADRRVLASLEQWLAAIHATRTNPRP